MSDRDIGVIGLGVMGRNLALNIESRGFTVAGFDVEPDTRKSAAEAFADRRLEVCAKLEKLAGALGRPRKVLMMVPAGEAVDAVITDLRPWLSAGDILIDGGNSFFRDTDRRARDLEAAGLRFLGTGVSGGQEGALRGPSIMPGGTREAYDEVAPILTRIAAQVEDGPCCAYMGRGSAGHYVKMVHNGIEYGIMQLICEIYDLLGRGLGLTAREMADVFAGWNESHLNSFLIEITASVLRVIDQETGQPLVDVILDKAGQKGTGKWTSQNALDLGIATPTINAAVEARIHSAFKDERVAASRVLAGPVSTGAPLYSDFIDVAREGLKLAVLTCYAQGFALLKEASKEYEFGLNFAEIARIWKGGCIIRARVLDDVQAALSENPGLPNLMVHARFSSHVNRSHDALRSVVGAAVKRGVPCLALCASLGYYDSYRQKRLPANLLQAQRDFFGAHTYQRVDREGAFHTEWKA